MSDVLFKTFIKTSEGFKTYTSYAGSAFEIWNSKSRKLTSHRAFMIEITLVWWMRPIYELS